MSVDAEWDGTWDENGAHLLLPAGYERLMTRWSRIQPTSQAKGHSSKCCHFDVGKRRRQQRGQEKGLGIGDEV